MIRILSLFLLSNSWYFVSFSDIFAYPPQRLCVSSERLAVSCLEISRLLFLERDTFSEATFSHELKNLDFYDTTATLIIQNVDIYRFLQ